MKQDLHRRLFTLHISMDEIKPLIWRRLLTDSSTTLFELHNYIQLMFTNWRNYHLYLFIKGGVDFGDPRLCALPGLKCWCFGHTYPPTIEQKVKIIFQQFTGKTAHNALNGNRRSV